LSWNCAICMSKGWLSWVRANDKTITDMLESQGANLVKATSSLFELVINFNMVAERNSKIKDLEHEGDQIAHKLFTLLAQTFVTPLDREDISRLASAIDEVLNYTDGTADRFVLFKIREPTPYMLELAKILLSASQEIYLLMTQIRKLKNANELVERCRAIKRYEHEGDKIYRTAIAELFETDNAIKIIKLKEIYETLEGSLDRCQEVADIVEDIALKYG
jgi:predicted phosphate transport protein (TIGR00153 family)